MALVWVMMGLLAGCGPDARSDAHTALDVIAVTVDPSYRLAVEQCDALEWAIVRRESSEADDLRDLASVRETCNGVFAGFDALRIAHEAARELVEGEARGDVIGAAVEALGRLWGDLQGLVARIVAMGGGA